MRSIAGRFLILNPARLNKLVRSPLPVFLRCVLGGFFKNSAFPFRKQPVGATDFIPMVVAVHRQIAPDEESDLGERIILAHAQLQFLKKSSGLFGGSVAPVREKMEENF